LKKSSISLKINQKCNR